MALAQPGKKKKPSNSSTVFRQLQELIKWVDLVIEVCDARVPVSSRHPNSDKIFGKKQRLVIFAKADLADLNRSQSIARLQSDENPFLFLSLKKNSKKNEVVKIILDLTKELRQAAAARGLLPRPVRTCIVGMPNVGKSSLINWLIGRRMTKVGDRPGITKGQQWVRIHPQLELLDTPGILPAFAHKKETELKLALMNLLPQSLYGDEELALNGFKLLRNNYSKQLSQYLQLEETDLQDDRLSENILEQLALKKNLISTGGKPDKNRAARSYITDLREGYLGRITLD